MLAELKITKVLGLFCLAAISLSLLVRLKFVSLQRGDGLDAV
jgi:hypothetical protein